MKHTRFLRNCVLLLTFGAFGAGPYAFAQVSVAPGTDAFFGPETIDGTFDDKLGDCDGISSLCDTSNNLSEGEAYTYSAAIFNTTKISTTVSGLSTEFTVPSSGGDETPLDARITGGASWRGSFYIVDFTKVAFFTVPSLGAKAEGFVRVSLVNVTDPNNPFDVGNDAIADFGCEPDREVGGKFTLPLLSDPIELGAEVGLCEEERSETFSFGARVIPGHKYQIQLSIVCQSTTGLPLTYASVCLFHNTPEFNLAQLLVDNLSDLDAPDIDLTLPSIELGSISVSEDLPGWITNLCDVAGEDCDSIDVNIDLPTIEFPAFSLPTGDIIDDFLTPVTAAIVNAVVPRWDSGFLHWDYMNVAIDPDLGSLVSDVESDILGQVSASETAIVSAVDTVGDQVEVVRTGVADSIRLVHTPNGRRSSGPIDGYPDLCGDGNCSWNDYD